MLPISEKKSVWSRLKHAKKPIFLYGMGDGAQKIMNLLIKHRIQISGVFASDNFVRGHYFNGYKVQKYSDVLKNYEDIIIVLAFGTARSDVMNHIYELCVEQEMYVPDISIADEDNFDEEFLEKNYSKIETVYNMLEESSKDDYCNLINFKLSGKLFYLDYFVSSREDLYMKILKLDNNENYLDIGAYNGDTIFEFIKYAGSYSNIYAIEPDKKNFNKLIKNTEELNNIEYFNIGIFKEYAIRGFDNLSGRNSKFNDDAKNIIEYNSIDNLNKAISYLKIDAEGEERNAILGGVSIIKKFKPKLNIAAYHKPSDVFEIPLQIAAIREDYKIYLYHNPYIPAWDTGYCFI